MSERTETFEIARRRHKGATKPKLPVTQGGILMPRGQATTTLYGGREQPDHQSGTRIADNVPLRFADFIEDAVNLHDELVDRLQAIIDWADLAMEHADELDAGGVRNLTGPVFDGARGVLAKARGA